jgi:sugar phosphate isomerase/epimerase
MNPIWSKQLKPQPQPLRPLFETVAAEGYRMVEWRSPTRNGITVPETDLLERAEPAAEILSLSKDFGVAMAYHAPQGPLWHFGVLSFEQAVSRLQESVRRASSIGAHILTIHLGIAVDEGRTNAIRHGARICRAVAPFAEDHGIRLCVENVFDEHSVATVDECTRFFACVDDPRIGLTFDTGHAHICSCLHEILAAFADRLAFTHIHDNDLTYDRHLLPGNGTIDWRRLIADLNHACYTGPLNFELREDATLPQLIRIWDDEAGEGKIG